MNNLRQFLLAISLLFALWACGDDYKISESSTLQMEQFIFVVPDKVSGEPFLTHSPIGTVVYIDVDEPVKFWAGYTLDGHFISTESAPDYYLNHLWTIGEESYNIAAFRYEADSSGHLLGSFQTVDFLGDTLLNRFDIYINSPINISLKFPDNGFNQIDPLSSEGVELRWDISGKDPWEHSSCKIFVSMSADSVWNSELGEVDCSKEISIHLPILSDSKWLKKHNVNLQDSSITLYWGVVAKNLAHDGFAEVDSSEIFHFSTLYAAGDSAKLIIPINYNGLSASKKANSLITLTNFKGDTIAQFKDSTAQAEIITKVAPQTGLRIFAEATNLPDFSAGPISIDIPKRAKIILDTIQFQDKKGPQIAIYKKAFKNGELLKLYALDQGVGINEKKASLFVYPDTTHGLTIIKYEPPFITFPNPCHDSCDVRISLFDNERNSSPVVQWQVKSEKDSVYLSGPFIKD
ncbi:MAG: hypothetical protein MJY47_04325 [Fibrobacter sp.]|nr:hypothetical protein [Fibrobacter sp.]